MTTLLSAAIRRKEWDLAALCLVLGVLRTAERYPLAVIDAMISELADELDGE